jgi:eukaryotic-like serine/threonine-protein kinase
VRVKALFEQALELPASARAAFIAEAAIDEAGRAELRSLLVHDAASTAAPGFLARSAADELVGSAARIGQRLGAWEIVQPLGAGGMGEVFEARRADGSYEGRAAIKLLKRGMDSAAVLQRFALERQALARLSHPHVARLLDAGVSGDGLPFFVLEHVDGHPIDQAVQGRPVAERLRLFLQLADAVAHAHRHLLVHRDLKPGNVLVDGEGQVKLLDFGIAKALDPLEGADGGATVGVARPFTPNYASPEQVRGEPVTIATDIYSLGVLLHQMLTGIRPTGRGATTPAEAARAVLEDQPTRPSRLSAADTNDAQWLHTRKKLEGDLDNILLKALEKTVERRYADVPAMAQDLRAYLAGFPVKARPASAAYVAQRFLARHRAASAAVALGLTGLLLGLAVAVMQMRSSEQARQLAERRFQQVRQMAGNLVFKHHDRIAALPGAIAARDALLDDGVRYLDSLVAEGRPEPGLARETAETYWRIAVLQGEQLSPSQERLEEAEANLAKALALLPFYLDSPDLDPAALPKAADMWLARAGMRVRYAHLADAVLALQQARSLAERALAQRPEDAQAISRLASVEGRLGGLLGGSYGSANLGRISEARPHLQRAVDLLEPMLKREPANVQWPHELAWAYGLKTLAALLAGDVAQAHTWGTQALAQRDDAARREPGNAQFQYQTAVARMALARVLSAQGRHTEALALQDEAAAIFQRTAAGDAGNRAVQRYMTMLAMSRGQALVMAGRTEEARLPLKALVLAQTQMQMQTPTPTPTPTQEQAAAVPKDFDGRRLQAETLLWAARAWVAVDAPQALAWALKAQALMQAEVAPDARSSAPPATDQNAARRWTLAQALGEEAVALQGLGRPAEAAVAARRAQAEWGEPPAYFSPWVARDRQLALTQ